MNVSRSGLSPELEARQTRAIKRATSLLHLNTGYDSKYHSLNRLTSTLANPHVLAFGGRRSKGCKTTRNTARADSFLLYIDCITPLISELNYATECCRALCSIL
ncbi:hypothetical protein CY34DRAFT_725522 [Suillus luteus UH-Slu-Lm8-n1]|uniref:Unplaced genomic scaffold CY34scaffold_88, whole genome shotgun sequence n=1 Tax=Suillus luteus UH-Slu-Lm8-n1 TaxID=930992 RepID=A0A0D0BIW5_9AGAM|nr:hypothetical protein CY34DRAFT_725522 [Suillus luteus UH-Slu-Lm8-n1]